MVWKSRPFVLYANFLSARGPFDDPKIAAWLLDAEKNKERSLVDLLQDYAKQKSVVFDMKVKPDLFDFACVKAHHSFLLSRLLRDKFIANRQEIRVFHLVCCVFL